MRRTATLSLPLAACLAVAALAVTPTPAQAGGLNFRVTNVATGKCLKWNGSNKAITAVTCSSKTKTQLWGWAGDNLATLSVPLPGQDCMVGTGKHETGVRGGSCSSADVNWWHSQDAGGKKTALASPKSGYLKITKSGKVIAGARVSGDRDQWKLVI
jgi:hypothetical protein